MRRRQSQPQDLLSHLVPRDDDHQEAPEADLSYRVYIGSADPVLKVLWLPAATIMLLPAAELTTTDGLTVRMLIPGNN